MSSLFLTDETLISASAVPHCGTTERGLVSQCFEPMLSTVKAYITADGEGAETDRNTNRTKMETGTQTVRQARLGRLTDRGEGAGRQTDKQTDRHSERGRTHYTLVPEGWSKQMTVPCQPLPVPAGKTSQMGEMTISSLTTNCQESITTSDLLCTYPPSITRLSSSAVYTACSVYRQRAVYTDSVQCTQTACSVHRQRAVYTDSV